MHEGAALGRPPCAKISLGAGSGSGHLQHAVVQEPPRALGVGLESRRRHGGVREERGHQAHAHVAVEAGERRPRSLSRRADAHRQARCRAHRRGAGRVVALCGPARHVVQLELSPRQGGTRSGDARRERVDRSPPRPDAAQIGHPPARHLGPARCGCRRADRWPSGASSPAPIERRRRRRAAPRSRGPPGCAGPPRCRAGGRSRATGRRPRCRRERRRRPCPR